MEGVLRRVKLKHIERTYDVRGFEDAMGFLELLARKSGRLLKGGEADVDGVAKMVLNDFLRGKIPWFTPPPSPVEGQMEVVQEKGVEGRKGALGEMGVVRKAGDVVGASEGKAAVLEPNPAANVPDDLLDPVIAEPSVAEIIPENIPDHEDKDFDSLDDDEGSSSQGELNSQLPQSSDNDDDDDDNDGNESDSEEGGASLLEAEDILDSDSRSSSEEQNPPKGVDVDGVVLEAAQELSEERIARPRKRKRKG